MDSLLFFIQSVPVVLLLLYFLFPCRFEVISQTILGKSIAVLIIMFYTYQDMSIGIIVCLLIVVFYEMVNEIPQCKRTQLKILNIQEQQKESFISDYTTEYANYISYPVTKEPSSGFENYLPNDFTSVDFAYPEKEQYYPKDGEALFRKEKCRSNQVEFKGVVVKHGYLPHIYPDFSFQGEPCNPCDLKCKFSIQEKKEDTKKLLESQNTRGVINSVKDIIFSK